MSRNLQFLRPCLQRGFQPVAKPEHAQIYRFIQRRFAQTTSSDAFTGPHDVEKQKRIDQLRKMKPLNDYHPRLIHTTGIEVLTVRSFQSKYDGIQETQSDLVSVFGTLELLGIDERRVDNVRKGPISASAWLQIDVPRY
jgi:lysyl-tRNA synthetase class 2